jgi:hypothetical protein
MTTMQTVRKGMPKWLMDAITQFMEETGAERIDIRRTADNANEGDTQVNVVMSDDEEPESLNLHSGALAVIPVGPIA